MLTLQRASAGSGKTYTLAQKYILHLIAFKSNEGKWKLRKQRQIDDALQHILAITFTNKATNEMKQRIINNLALLSVAQNPATDDETLKNTPYLNFFKELTGASFQEIGETASFALKSVLNNFSFFKISTIDSFFQEILRTFAYEANLNDSYQLEIDSNFVTDAAIDAALHELDTHPQNMGDSIFWLKTIMNDVARTQKGWNVFTKSGDKRSVYKQLRKALLELEKEHFKNIKDLLDSYLDSPETNIKLKTVYENLKSLALNERQQLLDNLNDSISNLESIITDFSLSADMLNRYFPGHMEIVRKLKIGDKVSFKYDGIVKDNTVLKSKFRKEGHPINQASMDFYALVDKWNNPDPDSYATAWNVYGTLLPYLGLILEVRKFISQILESNNLIQLSDTSFILKKIIGDEDSPFIYERLGNRLDNYLIDEFQDTSRMQWDIIRPLLAESLSKGKESLIIGDPKQSIYRFRNANHKLITEVVPASFAHEAKGDSKEDNTNWRSHSLIVKFNNYLFRNMAKVVELLSRKAGAMSDYMSLYSNVVQYPHNQEGKGYVEIRFLDKSNEDFFPGNCWLSEENIEISEEDFDSSSSGDDSKWDYDNAALNHVAPIVVDLLNRGYRSKDIGVLVSKNYQGKKIVESFLAYNETRKDGETKINFISEESLLISSSPVVGIIINVLQLLTLRRHPSSRNNGVEGEVSNSIEDAQSEVSQASITEKKRRPKIKWSDIKLRYELYCINHKEMSPAQRIMAFLESNEIEDFTGQLLNDISVPTLAAFVESIILTFTDEKMRDTEALYIASFQDLVNEYSASHPNDIASFLEWWNSRGKNLSVSSPASLDAVQIMTVHKSKGLEFKCVIIPFATDSFAPSSDKEEWRWVKPYEKDLIGLPPVLPVRTSSGLKGSHHEAIYKEFFDQFATDVLNMNYVAFTRAKNELYVLTKKPQKNSPNTAQALYDILSKETLDEELFIGPEFENIIHTSSIIKEGELDKITIGVPFTPEEIEEEISKEMEKGKEDNESIHFFNSYFVNKSRPKLRAIVSKVLPSGEIQN